MSLHPQTEYPIPDETRRVAQAVFPKGCLALHVAEALGPIYRDEQFAALFATRGQPALSPARLALVLVLQFVEGLSDRQAAEAGFGKCLAIDPEDRPSQIFLARIAHFREQPPAVDWNGAWVLETK